ncbi:unnamed protein product [Ambrosiozyma monospora]|uniref:Unnamed protein product n=1 Tax=Ambrosiozyma monospora TaxID=43982 RepID=A0ACB5TTC3_AMBMO|nr:unnamed protein product [Ambrosiozyma monospora]
MDWDEVDEIIYSHVKIYDVLVGFVYFEKPLGNNELGDEYFASNLEHIKGFTERISSIEGTNRACHSFCSEYYISYRKLNSWNNDPVKIYKSTPVFDSEIRLGCPVDRINLISCLSPADVANYPNLKIPNYDSSDDPSSVVFTCNGYPLTKKESATLTTQVGTYIDDDDVYHTFRVKSASEKYKVIERDMSDPNAENTLELIDGGSARKGSYYGKTIVLEPPREFPSFQAIDVISFVDKHNIPPWYYTGETSIILPKNNGSYRDKEAFDFLSQTMLKQNLVAITRTVLKRKKEVGSQPLDLTLWSLMKLRTA